MKLLYIFLEDDYKHILKGGYSLDNEFHIELDRLTKSITLTINTDYHNPFNSSILNISCIVGKNGIGKTTFFELLIAPLLWRLDGEMLKNKLHLLFYDKFTDTFLIESYINDAHNWSLTVDGISKNLVKNKFQQDKFNTDKNEKFPLTDNGYSVLPFQTSMIFHSLSPFDRIYTLIKEKLSASSDQVKHYHKRFKYIGINQIENNEVKYEHMTIVNLISLFFNENRKQIMNQLGYFFKNIELELNNEFFEFSVDLPDFNSFKGEEKKLLENYFTEELYETLQESFDFFSIPTLFDDDFFNLILRKYLNIKSPKRFILFLSYALQRNTTETDIIKIIGTFLLDLQKNIDIKDLFDSKQYPFLSRLITEKDKFLQLRSLTDNEALRQIVENKDLPKMLKNLKSLTAKNIIDFNIYLLKNENEVNFFRLSSGEKTLLSYFANIVGRVNELIDIQAEDATYNNLKNRTFMILIDEVELHLHPEWQRNFIKYINDFFQTSHVGIKFQFIIATHSPFVVSDIYNQNVIYLGETDRGTKTFGGNIFDIFKDDFYVSNTIGAFSESIIKDLSEFLYFLFVFEKAKNESNYFMLRDFLDLTYINTEYKNQENENLIENIDRFMNGNAPEDINKFEKIVKNQYFIPYRENRLFPEAKKIIDNIGEEVVRQHLNKMYFYLQNSNQS